MVPHLGLAEKGFNKEEYEVKSLGLGKPADPADDV
jgi:hypothetical protein